MTLLNTTNPLFCLRAVKEKISSLPNGENQAKWLCLSVLDISNKELLLNEKAVTKEQFNSLMAKADELISGVPLQYLLGKTEFMGLTFAVRERVLIPRNDTEPMTELAIKHIGDRPLQVLDLCCGSGCIGLSVRHFCKNAKVTLADISDDALNLSDLNRKRLSLEVELVQSDMFENIEGKYDVIISNPPYIPTEIIPSLDKQISHEPLLALDGGKDGLDFYCRIKSSFKNFLTANGLLLLEIGNTQGKSLLELFGGGEILKDLQGNDRIFRLES